MVALAGCGAPAAPIAPEPEPVAAVFVQASPPDPVPYDAASEAARLDRVDRALATELERRDERIAEAERANATIGVGSIGRSWSLERMMAACGRG